MLSREEKISATAYYTVKCVQCVAHCKLDMKKAEASYIKRGKSPLVVKFLSLDFRALKVTPFSKKALLLLQHK